MILLNLFTAPVLVIYYKTKFNGKRKLCYFHKSSIQRLSQKSSNSCDDSRAVSYQVFLFTKYIYTWHYLSSSILWYKFTKQNRTLVDLPLFHKSEAQGRVASILLDNSLCSYMILVPDIHIHFSIMSCSPLVTSTIPAST